jgi:hypothetical protein
VSKLAPAALVALLALVSAGAAIGSPATAAGTGAVGADTITSVRQADGNVIIEGSTTGTLGGTFDASFSESFRDVVHASGEVEIAGVVVLTGSTPCGSGTWTQRLVVHVAPDGSFTGQTATVDQGESTVPVTTEFSFVGASNTFTYRGAYTCR